MSDKNQRSKNFKQITASCPGSGVAVQYRVQTQGRNANNWHLYASFRREKSAESCIRSLAEEGVAARVVTYRVCPSAA